MSLSTIFQLFNSFLASSSFCRLLLTFANSFDPGQLQAKVYAQSTG